MCSLEIKDKTKERQYPSLQRGVWVLFTKCSSGSQAGGDSLEYIAAYPKAGFSVAL